MNKLKNYTFIFARRHHGGQKADTYFRGIKAYNSQSISASSLNLRIPRAFSSRKFIAILALAILLRFFDLGKVPPSLDWDENSNAYNAYSILETGKDEYGNFLPLNNRSFDDYKPPLYMYLNVVTVKFFDLTPFAARLPSAFFGTLTVILIYFLAKFIFRGQKYINTEIASQITMLLLATSPWHVHFSRVGFEANVGLFCAVAAMTAFLYGLKNYKILILSALLFGVSAYSYHSVRIYLPLLFLAAVFLYRREITKIPKRIIIVFLTIVILIVLPLLLLSPQKAITERYKVSTSELRREEAEKAIQYIQQDQNAGIPFANIINNRRIFTFSTLLDNYLWHFDLNYLFTKGDDNFRHHIAGQGMLFLWQLPFIISGVYLMVKKPTTQTIFILLWLLIAPIAAAPARPAPHAIRSEAMVIPLSIITAYAITELMLKKAMFAKLALSATALVAAFSMLEYVHNYYVHYPLDKASFWQYGYNQAAEETERQKDRYEKIRIDGELEQAYAFWLFSSRFDPATYQKSGSRTAFGKYIFNSPAPTAANELFVSPYEKFPKDFVQVKVINYPNGQPVIAIGHPPGS